MSKINPYQLADFFEFFQIFIVRFFQFLTGNLSLDQLASDEMQLFVLTFVSISASLVGVFLMLRRMAMLANSLSHTILLGIVIAFILHQIGLEGVEEHNHDMVTLRTLLLAAMITGLFTTFLTEGLTSWFRLPADASNGLIFSTLFALGIVLVTLFTRNAHIGIEAVMGNVDILNIDDVKLSLYICLANTVILSLFYKEFKITTFDRGFAFALGFSPAIFNYLLMTQVSFTAVAGFRSVGVLMILALFIGPPLTARLLTHRLSSLLILSSFIGIVSSFIGVALSRHFLTVYYLPISTGGLIVCIITLIYLLALLFSPSQGVLMRFLVRKKVRERLEKEITECKK